MILGVFTLGIKASSLCVYVLIFIVKYQYKSLPGKRLNCDVSIVSIGGYVGNVIYLCLR